MICRVTITIQMTLLILTMDTGITSILGTLRSLGDPSIELLRLVYTEQTLGR